MAVTPRERILEEMVEEMQVANDDLRLPQSIWRELADAALRAIEYKAHTVLSDRPVCNCDNTGYDNAHRTTCPLS